MTWTTDRRGFLTVAGAGLAAALADLKFAWAADGDTLRIRMDGDLQVLDPYGLIGAIEEVINRCTLATLIKLGDIREGNQWRPWAAEKIEWLDDTAACVHLARGAEMDRRLRPRLPPLTSSFRSNASSVRTRPGPISLKN